MRGVDRISIEHHVSCPIIPSHPVFVSLQQTRKYPRFTFDHRMSAKALLKITLDAN
jgi:hypothetical protein